MGGVRGLHCFGQGLGTEEVEVVLNAKNLGFCVKMVYGTHLHASCGYLEANILFSLNFSYFGGRGVWEPNV